jgi:hypothetical protein
MPPRPVSQDLAMHREVSDNRRSPTRGGFCRRAIEPFDGAHDGRLLTYRRFGGTHPILDIDYDHQHEFETETEFYLEFDYRRETATPIVGGLFRISANDPAGEKAPNIVVRMPCFYFIGKAWARGETDSVAANDKEVGVIKDPSAINVRVQPRIGVISPEDQLKNQERIVRPERGDMHREYIFQLPMEGNPKRPVTPYNLFYRFRVARRYYALLAAAVVIPFGASLIGAYSILLSSTSIGDRFLILIASLAFGPPLVLAIRQLFIDELNSYLRDSKMNVMLLGVIVGAPLITVLTFLLVTAKVIT